jgi:hypothetical protein
MNTIENMIAQKISECPAVVAAERNMSEVERALYAEELEHGDKTEEYARLDAIYDTVIDALESAKAQARKQITAG